MDFGKHSPQDMIKFQTNTFDGFRLDEPGINRSSSGSSHGSGQQPLSSASASPIGLFCIWRLQNIFSEIPMQFCPSDRFRHSLQCYDQCAPLFTYTICWPWISTTCRDWGQKPWEAIFASSWNICPKLKYLSHLPCYLQIEFVPQCVFIFEVEMINVTETKRYTLQSPAEIFFALDIIISGRKWTFGTSNMHVFGNFETSNLQVLPHYSYT